MDVSKDVSNPVGAWTLVLYPRQGTELSSVADIKRLAQLYRDIEPNDVVSLGFDTDGGMMAGLVNDVNKTSDPSGQVVGQTLTLTGSCLGKLLVQDSMIHASVTVDLMAEFRANIEAALGADHPLLVDIEAVWGPKGRDATPTFEGVGVKDVLDFILEHSGSIDLPGLEAAYGHGQAAKIIGTDGSVTTWNNDRVFSDRPQFYSGDLWGFIWSVLDKVFYEARIDYTPAENRSAPRVNLIVRPKPFDEDGADWATVQDPDDSPGIGWGDITTLVNDLPYHEIQRHELIAERLGVSDRGAFAYYGVTSAHDLIGNPSSMHEGLHYPAIDTWAAKRFGLRRMEAELQLVGEDYKSKIEDGGVAGGDEGKLVERVRDLRNRLLNWNRTNSVYERGSIRCAGRDEFRVGDKVSLPWALPKLGTDLGLVFYLVGVRWGWSFGKPYVSTLSLDRGHNRGVLNELSRRIEADAPASNPSHIASS